MSLLCSYFVRRFSHQLRNSRNRNKAYFGLRELLTADIQRIEGIRAVGTMLQQVLFRLNQLFIGFVLVKSISPTANASRLNSEDKVIVILAVEERHKLLLPCESLVDEQVLLIMPHRISEIHVNDRPAMAFKLMDDHPTKVLFVDRIVCPQGRSVIIENHRLILVKSVVLAEVVNESGQFPLEFDVERLQDVQPSA